MATTPLPVPTNPEPIDHVPFQGEDPKPLPKA
jgi:hypothetical protein